MHIIVNGESQEIESGLTLQGLLARLGKSKDKVAIEHNGVIADSEEFETLVLREHDRLEIVHFVGGG